MGLVKENIWGDIIEYVKDIWRSIKIIFYQKDLLEKAQQTIETITEQLEEKPSTATEIIKFLNSKDISELENFGIEYRETTILEVKKILTKKNLILQSK